MTRTARSLVLLVAVAACGDDGGNGKDPDARVTDMQVIDGLPEGCDYAELSDATNDDVSMPPGTPEATGLTFRDDTVICGQFDSTHFDGDITIDVDGYTFTVANETDALVRIRASGAAAIELVGIDIYTGANLTTSAGGVTFYGDHGVSSIHFMPGTYELAAFALHTEAIAAPVSYELEMVIDTPALRCPELLTGGYPETLDNGGNGNNGNDMVTIPMGAAPALSASATDNAENTNFTLSPSGDQRITGSAANITTADLYEDKDTFAFSTGSQPNELTVRLAWASNENTNLDFFLFEATTPTVVTRAIAASNTGPEAKTFSVKPNTAYWLTVAAKPAAALPTPYSVTLCTQHFTP
jgi:hypothetical protein